MMTVVETKSGITFYVRNVDELKEEIGHLKSLEEFKERYGEPSITVDGKKLEDFYKELELKERYAQCEKHILKDYPLIKQQSDISDKFYYETILRANGVADLDSDIVARIEKFYEGSSLDEVVSDVDEAVKEAYLQLIKTGIRVKWVQDCKTELIKSIEENREPNYPEYPLK
jgi:hypothetical protein